MLLCKNLQGYRNLIDLVSTAYLEGFYYKPRIDKDLLASHSEGLICLSACLRGDVNEARNRFFQTHTSFRSTAVEVRDVDLSVAEVVDDFAEALKARLTAPGTDQQALLDTSAAAMIPSVDTDFVPPSIV